jgi:protease-4
MKKFLIVSAFAVLAAALIFSVLLNLAFVSSLFQGGYSDRSYTYEKILLDGSARAGDGVAVVNLYGVISYSSPGQSYGSMVEEFVDQMKYARNDKSTRAVVVRIDSPGGEVTASDVMYHAIQECDAVKPVVIYMDSMAASGGYYAAVGGRYLMANELTITGSIGVIIQTPNFKGLADKVGVGFLTIKSGAMKDMLNPMREVTPEEKAYVQALVDETYAKFLGIVADNRNLDAQGLKSTIADGRIISGQKAFEAGLIDGVGYFEDALAKAREFGKLEDNAPAYQVQSPVTLAHLFRILGKAPASSTAKLKIELPGGLPELQAGRLYYLAPHLFGP